MSHDLKPLQILFDEARSLKGMIAEVACKARLLEQRFKDGCDPEVEESLDQMQADLDKYSHRLIEIFEEFSTYGIVPKME